MAQQFLEEVKVIPPQELEKVIREARQQLGLPDTDNEEEQDTAADPSQEPEPGTSGLIPEACLVPDTQADSQADPAEVPAAPTETDPVSDSTQPEPQVPEVSDPSASETSAQNSAPQPVQKDSRQVVLQTGAGPKGEEPEGEDPGEDTPPPSGRNSPRDESSDDETVYSVADSGSESEPDDDVILAE